MRRKESEHSSPLFAFLPVSSFLSVLHPTLYFFAPSALPVFLRIHTGSSHPDREDCSERSCSDPRNGYEIPFLFLNLVWNSTWASELRSQDIPQGRTDRSAHDIGKRKFPSSGMSGMRLRSAKSYAHKILPEAQYLL